MRIWILTENTTCSPELTAEHGLSLYIETNGLRILFDAGQSEAFADNAKKLGVDLSAVDLAVLSHGHYDHGGGLMRFLELNGRAPVYVSRHAFGGYHNASGKYIGLAPELMGHPRLIAAQGVMEIGDGLTLCAGEDMPAIAPLDSAGLTRCECGVQVPDDFRHEQHLLIREGEKTVLISGCSHRGILNIADAFRPDVLLGGFHFMKMDPQLPEDARRLEEAAQVLLGHKTLYYTGHCTGEAPYALLKARMGERLMPLTTGLEIVI